MKRNNIEKSFEIAIVLTIIFFVVEIIGGIISGSLSLLGDAGHMFRDVFALVLSLGAIRMARKMPTHERTFGYHRFETFAAFMNGVLLLFIGVLIIWEAYRRFQEPQQVESSTMFVVAIVGLLVNTYVAYRLHGSHDLNVRSAYLHVFTDLLSSIAVVAAAVWIFFTGQFVVDPVLGVVIAVFILYSAVKITWSSVRILLEFTPDGLDFNEVVGAIESVDGVCGVHNVHLWSLCSNINVLDAHIYTEEPDMVEIERMKRDIKKKLGKFNIKHSTLEFECEECVERGKVKKLEH